jgi:hypothetical protein
MSDFSISLNVHGPNPKLLMPAVHPVYDFKQGILKGEVSLYH